MPKHDPPHPGLSVRYDCLEPLGLSVTEAAGKLGVSRKQIAEMLGVDLIDPWENGADRARCGLGVEADDQE